MGFVTRSYRVLYVFHKGALLSGHCRVEDIDEWPRTDHHEARNPKALRLHVPYSLDLGLAEVPL